MKEKTTMQPICVPCKAEMYCSKNGVVVVCCFQDSRRPYSLTSADEYCCSTCDVKVIVGFAEQPYAEHYEEDFAQMLAAIPNDLRRDVFS